MKYTEQHEQLKSCFDLNKDEIKIPDSPLRIVNVDFQSVPVISSSFAGYEEDLTIAENLRFRYPVFMPDSNARCDNAIIYLHGLNEKKLAKAPGRCHAVMRENRPGSYSVSLVLSH